MSGARNCLARFKHKPSVRLVQPRRDRTYLVAGMTLLATIVLFWHLLPCPLRVYLDVIGRARYQTQWAISAADYRIARGLPRSQMGLLEIIDGVKVESATKVTFNTLERWRVPLAASGHMIIVEKRDGPWIVVKSMHWIS